MLRRFVEISKQGRAQPALHIEVRRAIPITAVLIGPYPIKLILMTGEGRRGEYQPEATISVGDVRDHAIDHRDSAGDERLLAQAHARIVEDPHAEMLVWRNDVDGVHGDPCARTKRNPDQSKGGRLSRGLQLALFEALLSRRLRGCWGDGGKSPEGPTCASHFANPATAIRDGQHILEHCEPLPEIDDPVTSVTLTVAKTLQAWIAGKREYGHEQASDPYGPWSVPGSPRRCGPVDRLSLFLLLPTNCRSAEVKDQTP